MGIISGVLVLCGERVWNSSVGMGWGRGIGG